MSFGDLYRSVRGVEWPAPEKEAFNNFSQEEKNAWVTTLAAEVDFVQTERKVGTDGVLYVAFWIEEKDQFRMATAAE